MKKKIALGKIDIGEGLPCILIAELGLNHNGSMKLAHDLIEAAAISGANLVKFQKRSLPDLATASFLDAPFNKCPSFGRTQREVRDRLELSKTQMQELQQHSNELGLLFSMSVFDIPSLQIGLELGLTVIKIASHSITNSSLLYAAAETGVTLVVSMGASTWDERDKAFKILKNSPLVLLHCISAYPTPEALIKLDTITELQKRYNCIVGYSGHEIGSDISVGAVLLGASIIERHFTLSKVMAGLDHTMSMEPEEFAEMARRIRRIEKVRGIVEGIALEELPARQNYHVAICANRNIGKGEIITESDICFKQPLGEPGKNFTGLEKESVIGRKTKIELTADQPIARDELQTK